VAENWVFRDYVENEQNVIREWLDELPVHAQAAIDLFLEQLAAMPQLRMPYARVLSGPCDGLIELRIKVKNIQYRPLVWYGPNQGEITLLMGAIEQGDRFNPRTACETALRRKQNMGREGYTCEHE
jgi:hypothetical protein